MEQTMSTYDLGCLYDVQDNTIRGWARRGEIPYLMTPSGRYRFIASEVEKALSTRAKENKKLALLESENKVLTFENRVLKKKLERIEDALR